MKKFYVMWGMTDYYGNVAKDEAAFDWFETLEQAEAFVEKKIQGNGGYFKLWKIAEGDYNEFLRIAELKKELNALKAKFYP